MISSYYDKIQTLYNLNSRTQEDSKFKFKSKIAYRPVINKLPNTSSVALYSEDVFSNPGLINLVNYTYFNNFSSVESLEESYENLKNLKSLYSMGDKNLMLSSFNFILPSSFTQVLDSFRPDFDENN
jgi:hypothetical protein